MSRFARFSSTAVAALGVLLPLVAGAQLGIRPNESCTVQVLNQTVKVGDDATWELPDIPTNGGQVRVRLNCTDGYNTRAGQSGFVVISPNRVNAVRLIEFSDPDPGPTSLDVTAEKSTLTDIGESVQLSVVGTYSSGDVKDLAPGALGTSYRTTNAAVATVNANGLVTALKSGTVMLAIWNEGVVSTLVVSVKVGADADEDGLPDDWENAVGLDPSEPLDALADNDGDNLNNLGEFAAGTDPFSQDTDEDTIADGEEVVEGADGWVTSPVAADSDLDLVPDAIEIEVGTDPTDSQDYDFSASLLGLETTPAELKLVFNTILGESSSNLQVTGILLDGTGVIVTGHPDVSYLSGNIAVASFGGVPGEVFAGITGETTVTVSIGLHEVIVPVEVTTFSPQAMGYLNLPGTPNGVALGKDTAYVACTNAGLQIVSLPPDNALEVVGSVVLVDAAHDVRVVGETAYVAAGGAGLVVVDVSEPAAPVVIGSADTPGTAWDLAVAGTTAVIADSEQGLALLDISDAGAPVLLDTLATPSATKGVDLSSTGTLAVVALGGSGVATVTVAGGELSVAGSLSVGADAREIALEGTLAFVAIGNSGMAIVDVSDPGAPTQVSSIGPGLFMLNDVAAFGTLAFGADYYRVNSVPIVQVFLPSQPVFADVVEFSMYSDDNGRGITADSQYVALTAGSRLFVGQYAGLEDNAGIPPTAVITKPQGGGQVVEGSKSTVQVEAFDDVFVDRVVFYLDGEVLGEDGTPPFQLPIDYDLPLGSHGIGAEAFDLAGNKGMADAIAVEVIEDPLTTVVGVVEDLDGAPVGDALVFFENTSISLNTEPDGTFSAPGVHTWEDVRIVAQGVVGEDIMYDEFGPFSPVLGGVTDVGALVLTTPIASTRMGPVVSGIITFGSGAPDTLTNITMGPIVSGELTFQTADGLSAVGELTMGPLVSREITFAVAATDAQGNAQWGPLVSGEVTFQATDALTAIGAQTWGPLVGARVTFSAGDAVDADGMETWAPLVAPALTFSTQPVLAGVLPVVVSVGDGGAALQISGIGLEAAVDLVFYRAGEEEPLLVATDLAASPDGTTLAAALSIDPTAAAGPLAVVPITATGTSATAAGTGNTLELVP